MRLSLKKQKFNVDYVEYDASDNGGSLYSEVKRTLKTHKLNKLLVTEPGEYRLLDEMQSWSDKLNCQVEILDDNRFIATHTEFQNWANNRKELIMEYWYREMRKKTGLLMDKGKPVGGKWNLDKQNRKPLKKKINMPPAISFRQDKINKAVMELVGEHFADHFGDLYPFEFAVTRKQALSVLEHFIEHCLPFFGDYQDAMQVEQPYLFHSVLSHYINTGLLSPLETCQRVEQAYYDGHAPLNAAEGFIRQIIGWREYIRGIYWFHMPDYAEQNHLKTKQPLPDFYWNAETDMNCMSQVINMTRQYAYSHHIQRLMVTGNFANLAGLDVKAVCEWYLLVYADAFEWVELPNTLGMALYGDGGIVATKPYVASGAYINRMSNFCADCIYDHSKRHGDNACPFTTLYWNYLMQHEKEFRQNRRMALIYKSLDRLDASEKKKIRQQANQFLDSLI